MVASRTLTLSKKRRFYRCHKAIFALVSASSAPIYEAHNLDADIREVSFVAVYTNAHILRPRCAQRLIPHRRLRRDCRARRQSGKPVLRCEFNNALLIVTETNAGG
jgi:hypothetical protein